MKMLKLKTIAAGYGKRGTRFCLHHSRSLILRSEPELEEIDIKKIMLKNFLRPGEKKISGKEKRFRAEKSGLILLGDRAAESLHRLKALPESWITKARRQNAYFHNHNNVYISFDGTLANEMRFDEYDGCRREWQCVPCLKFDEQFQIVGLCGGGYWVRTWNCEERGMIVDDYDYATCLSAVYTK